MLYKSLQMHQRRVGRSLNQAHCKGNLVPSRKQVAHKLPGTKGSLSGPKRVPKPLFERHSSHSYRQHHNGWLHKQRGGGGMKSGTTVFQETGDSQSPTHSRLAEYGSRQALRARIDHPE